METGLLLLLDFVASQSIHPEQNYLAFIGTINETRSYAKENSGNIRRWNRT